MRRALRGGVRRVRGAGLLRGQDPLGPCPERPSRSRKGHFTAKSRPGPPTDAPRAAQDRPLRPQELVGPPTLALRAAQDRPQTPQEQSRTANKGPRNRPGPPTEAPRTPLDCPQKAQEQPRTAHKGPDNITSVHQLTVFRKHALTKRADCQQDDGEQIYCTT